MEFIKVGMEGHVATIAFDHYAKRNALSEPLIEECLTAFAQFQKDKARVVVLRSATPRKVWSAGHDIAELPHADRDPLPYDDPLEQLLRAVEEFPAPVIAMVQGSAWGGACDLVMTCDMVFGDETCAFAITPAKLGLPYNAVGVLHFLNRLPLNMVVEMFSTAEPVQAERALRVGILNDLIPAVDLEKRVYEIAALITTRSPAAISSFKATARALAEAMPISPATFERIHGLRRRVYFGPDYSEGVRAFVEKRTPRF
ncbi:MAG TPA: methylmalonyl-CoA decarboxylase [Acetobacteraceae bacterium]|nr:methylmalonyl-CoA decarboxylase [Acetobacteraceae bacterium]